MPSFRFSILGDTHFTDMTARAATRSSGIAPDALRYTGFTKNVHPKLAELINEQMPDLLFSTGDLIEGMRPKDAFGEAADKADEKAAMALFEPCVPRFYRARGTHDRLHPWKEYQKIEFYGCVFLILDYSHWDEEQKVWFKKELEATDSAPRRFLFAHAPLFLFARHFFDNEPFRNDVEAMLKGHPVDAYFCGHTHNQVLSFHNGMLQVVGSSIGYPVPEPPALEEWHAIPEHLKETYFWGIPEDFDPAFWTVDVNDEEMTLTRTTLHGEGGKIIQKHRFERPEILSAPVQEHQCIPPAPEDLLQIRTARLNFFAASKVKETGSRFVLNGTPLGGIPHGVCYEARKFIMLPQEMLKDIQVSNKLEIRFPEDQPFAYGSFTLSLELLDGRRIISKVAPEKFVCGDHPDFTYARPDSISVQPGSLYTIELNFAGK